MTKEGHTVYDATIAKHEMPLTRSHESKEMALMHTVFSRIALRRDNSFRDLRLLRIELRTSQI